MKLNKKYVYRKICGQTVLIPSHSEGTVGAAIYLNQTANEIYCYLKDGKTPEEIILQMQEDYDAEESVIRNDVEDMIQHFLKSNVLLEDEV